MRSSILTSFFFFFLFIPFFALAGDDDFTVYHAQNRPAAELVEAAQGLVNAVRISHMNEKIVIYGTKSGRTAALRLMKELDTAARMYRIHVRTVAKGSAEREAKAIEGSVGNDTVSAGKRRSGVLKGGGGTISVGGVSATAESETAENTSQGAQSVTVIDGGIATISAGSGIFPTAVRIRMRAQGKNGAHLKLAQQKAGGRKVQNLSTEIDLKLGVWRTVGELQGEDTGSASEILGSASRASASKQQIQVMVELDK